LKTRSGHGDGVVAEGYERRIELAMFVDESLTDGSRRRLRQRDLCIWHHTSGRILNHTDDGSR
jgi:hypothetical protein